jgi:hypothetical protein
MTSLGCLLRPAAIVVAAGVALPVGAAGLRLGDSAPVEDLALVAADGRTVALGTFGDNGLLVVFHSADCDTARDAEPAIAALGNRAVAGLVRTFVVDPSADALAPAAGALPQRFERLSDAGGRAVAAFGATHVPEAFLFDGQGRLVYHGFVAGGPERADLAAALESTIARQPVASAESAPAGCAIDPPSE